VPLTGFHPGTAKGVVVRPTGRAMSPTHTRRGGNSTATMSANPR